MADVLSLTVRQAALKIQTVAQAMSVSREYALLQLDLPAV
jgi:hypothetical protein